MESAPNIDILINPDMKKLRIEYEQHAMNKLKNFFKDRNSTKIYPNLFSLLWYTKESFIIMFDSMIHRETKCVDEFFFNPTRGRGADSDYQKFWVHFDWFL